MADQPAIYLLCGEDEFAIDEMVAGIIAEVGGDPTMADMNTSHLDGRTHSYEDLVKAVHAMPFLAERRLVTYTHPTDRIKHPSHQKKLIDLLDHLPPTTLIVITEDHVLTADYDRKKEKIHWLERWALKAGERVVFKEFRLPTGSNLNNWVQRRAVKAGGKFTPAAADALIAKTGAQPRMLNQEIQKLLIYVNYARAVDPDDVQHVTPFTAPVPDFALINALRSQDARQALSYLHRELEEKDPLQIFGSITNQFRQVLLVREIIEQGGNQEDVKRLLNIHHPYAVQMAMEHARAFTLPALESIYHRLLATDTAMKTGGMESELALDLLLLELTNASR